MSDLGERRGLRSSACPGGIAALSWCIFVVGWSFRGGRSGGCVCPGGDAPPNAGGVTKDAQEGESRYSTFGFFPWQWERPGMRRPREGYPTVAGRWGMLADLR